MKWDGLQPYPAYRDSGIKRLGPIPKHWQVRRIRTLARIINGATPSSGTPEYWDGDLLWVTPNDLGALENRYIANSARKLTWSGHQSCGTSLAPAGSVAISIRAPIGHLGIMGSVGCVNQGCRLLTPDRPTTSEYLYYGLKLARSELQSLGRGSTFAELSRELLADCRLTLPPIREQVAIVRFLDHADRRIRRYTRAKERLIELLEEQRQAIIHQAVTGQIDVRTGQPYPAYKDSGVEWLGEVPEHWEVRRLRNVGKAIIGLTYAPQDVGCEVDGVLVLRASNVSENQIVDADNVFVRCSVPDRLITRVGDILICSRSGSRALIGKNARIDSASSGVTFGAFMTVFRSNYNNYLRFVFNSQVFEYQSGAFLTSTINQLTLGMLYSIKIPLPPPVQQERIIRYLEEATGALDKVISCSRRQIALMREYRIRLIADVVTGKLDVRDASAVLADLDPLAIADTQETTPKPEANSKAVVPHPHP